MRPPSVCPDFDVPTADPAPTSTSQPPFFLCQDMIFHHIATMSLIACSYSINLVRYGTMWMALFDIRQAELSQSFFPRSWGAARGVHLGQLRMAQDSLPPYKPDVPWGPTRLL